MRLIRHPLKLKLKQDGCLNSGFKAKSTLQLLYFQWEHFGTCLALTMVMMERRNGGKSAMVSKCVNPFCHHPFRYLSQGKLFIIEFPHNAVSRLTHRHLAAREHFWLCAECARLMTVAVRREHESVSVRIINLPASGATKLKFVPPKQEQMPLPPRQQVLQQMAFSAM
jgi:hypothetical protein